MLTSSYRSLIAACVLALTATAAQAQASAPGGPLTVRPTAADTSVAQRATVRYRKLWTGAKPGARAYDIDAHPSVTAGSRSGGHAQIRFPGDLSYHGGIVHSIRAGRESLFEFDPQPMNELQEYLGRVSAQWDQVLSRLKTLVESSPLGPHLKAAVNARITLEILR